MKRSCSVLVIAVSLCLWASGVAEGRGFGGFRGGGGFGGARAGGFGGYGGARAGGYGGDRFGGYGGYGGARAGGYGGERYGGYGGYGGERFGGYGGERLGGYGEFGGERAGYGVGGVGRPGVGVGGVGRPGVGVGGVGRPGVGVGGVGEGLGSRLPTDYGLAHYSSLDAGHARSTAYWSRSSVTTRASYVRSGFAYYGAFRPGWYARYPGCWIAPGWAPGFAWTVATWPVLNAWFSIPAASPVDYDYGSNVVFQNNFVYVNGQNVAPASDYAQQAISLAEQGQQSTPPANEEWKPLGVFALVQGDEKSSNNVFQLAVDQQGNIRGNYYDGLMDTTTPVYGSVDKNSQRAAWTIGKKNDRVFEAGIYNLTQDQTPCLVHVGKDKTQQWLLVRLQNPPGQQ